VLLDWAQDPLGAITADVGELCAALWAELVEEALDHLLAAAFGGPDQPARDVIDDQRQVALPSTPTDLVKDRFILPLLQVISGLQSSFGASSLCASDTPPRSRK